MPYSKDFIYYINRFEGFAIEFLCLLNCIKIPSAELRQSGSIFWPFNQLTSQTILMDRLWCDGKKTRNRLFIMRSFLCISFLGIFRWWPLGPGQFEYRGVKCWYRKSKYAQVCQLQLAITANSFSLLFSYPLVSIKAVGDLAIFPFTNKDQHKMDPESLAHRGAAVPELKVHKWWLWISDCKGKHSQGSVCHFTDNNSNS